MNEAINFPRLGAVTSTFQYGLQPNIFGPLVARQLESALNAVLRFVPKHLEDLLFLKNVARLEKGSRKKHLPALEVVARDRHTKRG